MVIVRVTVRAKVKVRVRGIRVIRIVGGRIVAKNRQQMLKLRDNNWDNN